jgi:hypothetical protein
MDDNNIPFDQLLTEEPEADTAADGKPRRKPKPIKQARWMAILDSIGYTNFRLNELTQLIEINGKPMENGQEVFIRSQVRDRGFASTAMMEEAYEAAAYAFRYNPMKKYLSELKWDGEDTIHKLALYFMDKHPKLNGVSWFEIALRRWLCGAIRKYYEQEQNFMLVLEGRQGIGKNYLGDWLMRDMPAYIVDAPIKPDNKDSLIALACKSVWNVSEVNGTTRRSDREALKAIITLKYVDVRFPYARHATRMPAFASFIGSFNDDGSGYLSDPTGSRRFVTVGVTHINREYSSVLNPSQVWAQAYHLYLNGETGTLSDDEQNLSSMVNRDYETSTSIEEVVERDFAFAPAVGFGADDAIFVPSDEVLKAVDLALGGVDDARRSREIKSVMVKHGLEVNKRGDIPTGFKNGTKQVRGFWGVVPRYGVLAKAYYRGGKLCTRSYDELVDAGVIVVGEPESVTAPAVIVQDELPASGGYGFDDDGVLF